MKPLQIWLVFAFVSLSFLSAAAQNKFVEVQVAGILPEIKKTLLLGDLIKSGVGYNNITLRARNAGKTGWSLSSGTIYKVVFDSSSKHYTMAVKFKIHESKWINIEEPLVIRIVAGTTLENCIWTEVTSTKADITQPLLFTHYSGIEGDAKASLKQASNPVSTTVLSNRAEKVPMSNSKKSHIVELKLHQASISFSDAPDSLSNGLFSGVLSSDEKIIIGNQAVTLSGKETVFYNPGQGYIVEATLKGDQVISTALGSVTLKGGSRVRFHRFKVANCVLASNAELIYKTGKLVVQAGISPDGDIAFDEDGRIKQFYNATTFRFETSGQDLEFPAHSVLRFQNGQLITSRIK